MPAASRIVVRCADESDLDQVATMVEDFVRGHPAAGHPRPLDRARAAWFGNEPVARLFVAARDHELVGMVQWSRVFDMFWSMFGGRAEWLYVRPHARGLGVSAALLAAMCDDVRRSGGEYVNAGYEEELAVLYERVAIGRLAREGHVSGEAFQQLADLAGASPRDVVRNLPAAELSRTPARPRPA